MERNKKNIELIIGGHKDTLLDKPTEEKNKDEKEVFINQVGWAGLQIGKLDYVFEKSFRKKMSKHHTVIVSKKSIAN